MNRNNWSTFLFGDSMKSMITVENILRFLLFICIIISILPFSYSIHYRVSRTIIACYICILIIHIYLTYGRPQFNMNVLLLLLLLLNSIGLQSSVIVWFVILFLISYFKRLISSLS